jgi:hypothetical protein
MDKLLEMLGVQKLDEQEQEAIKEKLNTLIELKAKEAVDEMLQAEKDKLIERYEEKFDAYKEDITTKFSNFVDDILESEMAIPEKVLEYARKGELYSDLIEQFKVRLGVDEGLLDEEVKALLKEAKKEIQDLRKQLDDTIAEKLEVKGDAQDLASQLYVRKKCDGMTVEQSTHVMAMLEGVKDKAEIDRKFDIIVEAYGNGNGNDEDDDDEDDDKKKKKKDKKDMKESNEDGKGQVITEDDDLNKVNEDDESPFGQHLKHYLNVLKENKV